MKIAKIDISFADTNDVSINVWMPGCKLMCDECFTPQLKEFDAGSEISMEELIEEIRRRMELTSTVCFIGGNPPDHKNINEIIKKTKELGTTVWVYSGYEFDKIKNEDWVKHCDYIKVGPYIKELKNESGFPASTNQKLMKNNDGEWIELEGLEYA